MIGPPGIATIVNIVSKRPQSDSRKKVVTTYIAFSA